MGPIPDCLQLVTGEGKAALLCAADLKRLPAVRNFAERGMDLFGLMYLRCCFGDHRNVLRCIFILANQAESLPWIILNCILQQRFFSL